VRAVSRGLDRIDATFDDPNLVANAGLLLVATLVSRLGLEALIKGDFSIRAGFHYEGPTDTKAVTWGVGFENSSGDIEYGIGIPVGTPFKLGGLVQQLGIRLKT
jgi:hypothetical protein